MKREEEEQVGRRRIYTHPLLPYTPPSYGPYDSPLLAPTITDLTAILAILRSVDTAATLVCNEIDNALEPEHEERQALKDLRKGLENLKSDIMVYEVLLSPKEMDTPPGLGQQYVMGSRSSSYAHTANNTLYHRVEGIESLETALKATRLVLEENPPGNPYGAMMDPFDFESETPRRALNNVLGVLKANFRPGDLLDLIGNLKDATSEISVCQRNNERAFKFMWYRHVAIAAWQRTGSPKIDNGSHHDHPWQLAWQDLDSVLGSVLNSSLDSVLDAFRVDPFAVSPERTDLVYDLHTFAILNRNGEATTRLERFARQLGRAWVDDRVSGYHFRIQELGALQTSLLELLWSGTVEQLKQHSPHSSSDPERQEFERAVGELERVLQGAMVRSKKEHFSIAFCGMVKAGKSMILNALMGRSILPSDGEYHDSRAPHPYLLSLQFSFLQLCRAGFAMSKARQSLNCIFKPKRSSSR